MATKRRQSPKRKIHPVYYVFCEGKTEEAYSTFLRQKYRFPIQIKTKVAGQNISDRFIISYFKKSRNGNCSDLDKIFLMYDAETNEMIDRLRSINKGIILPSCPCIELWFLLHFQDQNANISCDKCRHTLKKHDPNYEKGKLNLHLVRVLWNRKAAAIKRSRRLAEFENPSSSVYKLLEELEKFQAP